MRINWGKAVGAVLAIGLVGLVGVGAFTAVNAAQTPDPQPAAPVTLEYGADYDRASAVAVSTADRDARAAEAARVAAEQAAAAAKEAEAIEAEEQPGDPVDALVDAPAEEPEPVDSGCPAGYIDDPSLGCYSPICQVLDDGTEVPCVGNAVRRDR